jgi:undecaprenyl-diphosphatase
MESHFLFWDKSLFIFINRDLGNAVFDTVCPILRTKETWIPLYLLIAFFAYKKHGKQALLWLVVALLTVLFTDQTAHLFKIIFERQRPCNEASILPSLILRVAHCNNSFSFFSAHAANHFGQSFIFHSLFKNRIISIAFFCWALAISFAQVYVGVHYPSDVIVGALVGIGIGFLFSTLEKRVALYFTK